jgi:hypothetical protein
MKNKETIEEAAEDFYEENAHDITFLKLVEFGAKWQAERMYSEEEVKKFIKDFLFERGIGREVQNVNEWFEQFKKK